MQLSAQPDPNIQLLEFIDAVNAQFKVALSPGNTVCLDESMVGEIIPQKALWKDENQKKTKTNWQWVQNDEQQKTKEHTPYGNV